MEKYFGFAKELMDRGLATERDPYENNSAYDQVIDMTEDIPFYKDLAKSAKGKVLDIGCGTGRIMVPLLKDGVDVTGMDLSEDMLNTAEKKLRNHKGNFRLIPGDMREFFLDEQFSLIIIPYCSMIYMYSDEDRRRVFRQVYKHLEAGGTLAFDFDASVEEPGISKPWLSLQTVDEQTGEVTLQTVQMMVTEEHLRIMNILHYHSSKNEARVEVESVLEATCKAEHMQSLLEEEGFSVEGLYKDYQYTPYDRGELCVVVAKKL